MVRLEQKLRLDTLLDSRLQSSVTTLVSTDVKTGFSVASNEFGMVEGTMTDPTLNLGEAVDIQLSDGEGKSVYS